TGKCDVGTSGATVDTTERSFGPPIGTLDGYTVERAERVRQVGGEPGLLLPWSRCGIGIGSAHRRTSTFNVTRSAPAEIAASCAPRIAARMRAASPDTMALSGPTSTSSPAARRASTAAWA